VAHPVATTLREQLLERRRRLESAIPVQQNAEHLLRLLNEVDSALGRIESGSYGLCATCNEPIEREWLAVDPLARTCLDHMSAEQRQALEQDLQVACRIQAALLPRNNLKLAGWDICYQYEPAGAVGGDYCDILPVGNDILFAIADVSGKGVGPAMLASQLHAIFRSIIAVDQPLGRLMERVNRIFCGSTTPSRFATLVCGRATPSGEVEICNAGHCPPLWIRADGEERIAATGLPLGIFCSSEYTTRWMHLQPGETLLLYTDGLTDSFNPDDAEYGIDRLCEFVNLCPARSGRALVEACAEDWTKFRDGMVMGDDLTIMAVWRAGEPVD